MRYLFFLLLAACSTTSEKSVTVARDSVLTDGGVSKKLKAGESFKLKESPVYLDAPGRNTLVVVPASQGDKKIEVDLVPLSISSSRDADTFNTVLSSLLPKITEVQASILSGDCEAKAETLVNEYKHLSYLMLLKASCLASKEKKTEARQIAEELAKNFPGNAVIQSFLEALK